MNQWTNEYVRTSSAFFFSIYLIYLSRFDVSVAYCWIRTRHVHEIYLLKCERSLKLVTRFERKIWKKIRSRLPLLVSLFFSGFFPLLQMNIFILIYFREVHNMKSPRAIMALGQTPLTYCCLVCGPILSTSLFGTLRKDDKRLLHNRTKGSKTHVWPCLVTGPERENLLPWIRCSYSNPTGNFSSTTANI